MCNSEILTDKNTVRDNMDELRSNSFYENFNIKNDFSTILRERYTT